MKLTPTQMKKKMKHMLEIHGRTFKVKPNQEKINVTQDSMIKARAKILQEGLNACLQVKFSVFNKELELEESLGHQRVIMNLEIKIHSHL